MSSSSRSCAACCSRSCWPASTSGTVFWRVGGVGGVEVETQGGIDLKISEVDLGPVLDSIREAADASQAADRLMGESAIYGGGLAQALDELAAAARSVSALADTLVRHPEALLRGR